MKELNNAALLQILQAPLIEWRRLPVKHPSQIPQRNQVIAAIEELCRRTEEYDAHCKELEASNGAKNVQIDQLKNRVDEVEKLNLNLGTTVQDKQTTINVLTEKYTEELRLTTKIKVLLKQVLALLKD